MLYQNLMLLLRNEIGNKTIHYVVYITTFNTLRQKCLNIKSLYFAMADQYTPEEHLRELPDSDICVFMTRAWNIL